MCASRSVRNSRTPGESRAPSRVLVAKVSKSAGLKRPKPPSPNPVYGWKPTAGREPATSSFTRVPSRRKARTLCGYWGDVRARRVCSVRRRAGCALSKVSRFLSRLNKGAGVRRRRDVAHALRAKEQFRDRARARPLVVRRVSQESVRRECRVHARLLHKAVSESLQHVHCRWAPERLGATASRRTGVAGRMRWARSEPSLRSDPAASPRVCATATRESGSGRYRRNGADHAHRDLGRP